MDSLLLDAHAAADEADCAVVGVGAKGAGYGLGCFFYVCFSSICREEDAADGAAVGCVDA